MTDGIDRRIGAWARAAAGRPAAVVLGASVNGLSFVRSLGRRGIPTLLLDSEKLLGAYTRFGEVALLPSPGEHPAAWVGFLDELGRRLSEPAVLFATSDDHVLLVSENADRLRERYRFLVPEPDVVRSILNKRVQYTLARAEGIPVPRTHFPETGEDVRSVAASMTYPCILKPYTSAAGRKKMKRKVLVAGTPQELVAGYSALASPGSEFMVQEIIPGGDDTLYGYLAFWDGGGKERAWLTKRKLRQSDPFGDGSLQVTVDAEEVAELSRRLLLRYGYKGFVGVEFRHDARDGSLRLMEINPRTVSGNQLAIASGIDFPWLGYVALTGGRPGAGEEGPFLSGVKYVNEEWDLKAFLGLRNAGRISFAGWIASIRDAKAWAIGAADDPLPLVVMLGRVARAAVRGVVPGRRGA